MENPPFEANKRADDIQEPWLLIPDEGNNRLVAGIGWDQLVPDARQCRNPACCLGKKICPSLPFPPELAIILDQIDEGLTLKGTQTTLEDFLTGWLVIAKTTLRPKPAQQHEKMAVNHIIHVLGKVKLKDLRPDTVDSFYQNRIKAGVGVRTIRYCHAVLHRALGKAVLLGQLTRNPVDGATPPRMSQAEINVLDETQVIQFLIAAQGKRHEFLFHLAVKTGIRQAELPGLKWADLDWRSGILQVRHLAQRIDGQGFIFCEPKTKTGRRSVQLGETILQMLRKQFEKQRRKKEEAGERWKENDLIFASSIGTPTELRNLLGE